MKTFQQNVTYWNSYKMCNKYLLKVTISKNYENWKNLWKKIIIKHTQYCIYKLRKLIYILLALENSLFNHFGNYLNSIILLHDVTLYNIIY